VSDDGRTPFPDDPDDSPVSPADVASAGRSCSVILVVAAATLLLICLATVIRLAFM
jgi:hypothetical protein